MKPVLGQGESRYYCTSCGKSYKYSCTMSRHMKYECSNKRHFFCVCGYAAFRKDHMQRHMRMVHGIP